MHLHLDCSAGVAGDMILAALLDLEADADAINDALIKIGVTEAIVEPIPIVNCGVSALSLNIDEQETSLHRTWTKIRAIFDACGLQKTVVENTLSVFKLIAETEARIHGTDIDTIHFHELSGIDSLVEIMGVAIALETLNVTSVSASEVAVGSGTIKIAHGIVSVPAPATAELAIGIPTMSGPATGELATPTGMALLKHYTENFGPAPAMITEKVGYGSGTKQFKSHPNVVRAYLGVRTDDKNVDKNAASDHDQIIELKANIDDQSPELLAEIPEALLSAGAADVFTTPIFMKKGRSGHLITALVKEAQVENCIDTFFAYSSTFGIRQTICDRTILERRFQKVETHFGAVDIKLGIWNGKVINANPEYESCKALAKDRNVPTKHVYNQALASAQSIITKELNHDDLE